MTLASWADGSARAAIVEFVEAVTSGADAVPEAERVAVFDNDGTLWTEKPMPTQLHFIVQQWAAAAQADPSLADRQPYQAAANGDFAWLGGAVDKHYAGDDSDLKVMIGAILASTAHESVEDYQASVAAFYRDAKHLTLHHPYSRAVYQPMVELLGYLEAHDFTTYIVSGGDRDFMRPMTEDYYGIPPERVVGSAVGLEYDAESNDVRYSTSFDYMDDGPMKPVRIWSRIGRRPILAGGNSNGDVEMLRFVQKHPRSLSLLVHHDDDTGRGDPPYDKGAERALDVASEHGFQLISIKDDWSRVFPAGP
ncbi:hydrolase [Beutenbergia cavernae DSM 12333]|uniref:Hydrolase n=1 Tax=Beutenbergia cavernae (strain ATCC BAA-8 / DSM 12333 / CCUG 43141 / JCM 11478 / NBRC 16432 / NCIMB 13614 / HKI 0122) TaxID=471853 RepID=C5BYR7_BEUC1|nr:HAD family hydrolase [Beutenbergia cavernae]ACQ79025.1 hydrolase [Beutenbergia cavernae DSM 12333]